MSKVNRYKIHNTFVSAYRDYEETLKEFSLEDLIDKRDECMLEIRELQDALTYSPNIVAINIKLRAKSGHHAAVLDLIKLAKMTKDNKIAYTNRQTQNRNLIKELVELYPNISWQDLLYKYPLSSLEHIIQTP